MSNKRDFLLIVITFVLAVVFLCLINSLTTPLIEKGALSGEMAPLYEVMEGASGFEKLNLTDLPDTVEALYEETGGMGYVVKAKTDKGFTGDYIKLTIGISKEGKIVGITLDEYPETKDFGSGYPLTFIGADSTLSSTDIVAGVTYSSTAFRNAVNDAFTYLVEKEMVKGMEKSDEQKFTELLPSIFKEAVSPKGLLVIDEFKSSLSRVILAYKAGNNSALAYLVKEDDKCFSVIVSLDGASVYDEEGKVCEGLSKETLDAVENEAASSLKDYSKSDLKKIKKLGSLSESAEYTKLSIRGIHSSLTTAYSILSDGSIYYGFALRPYGFGNETMTMYILLTSDGKIVEFSAKELIIEADYFTSYTLSDSYYSDFTGLDSSWSGSEAIIAGATLTSDAVKEAVNDAFSAYEILKEAN